MKLTKEQLDSVVNIIYDYSEYRVEINGPQDYDVAPSIPKELVRLMHAGIQRVLDEDKADLQELFDIQMKFQEKVRTEHDYKHMPWIEHVRLMFIGIITEACEVLELTNWKPWKRASLINGEKLQGEIIDLWHFVINLTIATDMDAKKVIEKFKEKNKVNIKRQEDKY